MTFSTAKILKKSALVACGLFLLAGVAVSTFAIVTTQPVYAADADPKDDQCTGPNGSPTLDGTPCIPGEVTNSGDPAAQGPCKLDCILDKYVNPFTKLLAALVGIVVTGSIIWGGIQYSTSGGDPGKVQAAKQRIFNAVVALLSFLFLFAFLQWLVPGGIF